MFVFCKGVRPKTITLIQHTNKERAKNRRTVSKMQRNGVKFKYTYEVAQSSPLPNVWLVDASNGARESTDIHPAAFPEIIPERHIYSWSNEGDLVYDPFMGSGTTAKMAHLQKRKWIGSEISAEYVALAEKRICPHLNQLYLF